MSNQAKFLSGSTMRHVIVMSLTSSIGLMAIFFVDLLDMLFLSMLGEVELASAVGYAGSILFFTTSVNIGLAIAMGALVSRNIGAGEPERAKRYLMNVYGVVILITIVIVAILMFLIPTLTSLLGAKGRAAELANAYLYIMIPSMPILGIGMTSGAALRAVGDAKRSMNSTLAGGAVNAVLDPVFIFGLNMGVEGAAAASVMARCTILAFGLWPVYKVHHLLTPFELKSFFSDLHQIFTIALPAILTNIATPIGTAYVTAAMAKFGDSAVAGMSVTARLTPVAFGVVFAVSGAVGPIIGQNFGAKNLARVRQTIYDALLFVLFYVLGISLILVFTHSWISDAFSMKNEARDVIAVFCLYVSFTYFLSGATFVGNAAFNNLGRAPYSTIVNFGKATIGTVPFVYVGSLWFEAEGVLVGQAVGASVFGVISIAWVFWYLKGLVKKLEAQELPA